MTFSVAGQGYALLQFWGKSVCMGLTAYLQTLTGVRAVRGTHVCGCQAASEASCCASVLADPAAAHARARGAAHIPRAPGKVSSGALWYELGGSCRLGLGSGCPGSLNACSPYRDDTHKVDVINFAQNKATKCLQNDSLLDKASASLLWNFIILLCRQNGVCALGFHHYRPLALA